MANVPEIAPYCVDTPWVQQVKYVDDNKNREYAYEPLWDISNPDNYHNIEFNINAQHVRRGEIRLEANPMTMTELFFPDSLMDEIVAKTNAYAASRLPPGQRDEVTRAEILRFFAIYYYMGLVKLPNKRDYWRGGGDNLWPTNLPCLSMTRDRFAYIWRNIHLVGATEEADDEDQDVDEDEDDDFDEPEDIVEEAESPVSPQGDEREDVEEEYDTKWYEKARLFLEHLSGVSGRVCVRPGSRLSADEMMKRYKGRTGQKTKMKNKPIKEGYKFFALCDAETGYVYDMMPNGRLEKTTTHDVVMTLACMIPTSPNHNYVIGMDNYFTWAKVVTSLTEMGVGCVGTSRFERGWPPKEFRDIKDDRFNTLYTMVDKGKFLMARWIDNNQVTMVTNVHKGDERIKRTRRKPRENSTNKGHLQQVWGDGYIREIEIPGMIDDYNHWMLGVDKADQLIAYYRPNLRCRRNWMPLLFHGLDVARVNSYIITTSSGWLQARNRKTSLHKDFVCEYIKALLARATTFETRRTRRLQTIETPSPLQRTRRRTSTKNPRLPDHRKYGDMADHIRVDAPKQRNCRMCSYLHFRARKARQPLPVIRRPKKMCLACKDHLCNEHFDLYHTIR
eukprot:scaffold1690_cov182-Amphora_coffeaeformis.AAC.53